jgi:hypothetical protein
LGPIRRIRLVGGLAGGSVGWLGRGLRAPSGGEGTVGMVVVRRGGCVGNVGVESPVCGCSVVSAVGFRLCARESVEGVWDAWVVVGVLCVGVSGGLWGRWLTWNGAASSVVCDGVGSVRRYSMSENSWSEGGEYVAEGLTASSWSAASSAAK